MLMELTAVPTRSVPCARRCSFDSLWEQAVEVSMRFAKLYFVEEPKRSDVPAKLERRQVVCKESFILRQSQLFDETPLQPVQRI